MDAAADCKDRSPMVERIVRGTIRSEDEAEFLEEVHAYEGGDRDRRWRTNGYNEGIEAENACIFQSSSYRRVYSVAF